MRKNIIRLIAVIVVLLGIYRIAELLINPRGEMGFFGFYFGFSSIIVVDITGWLGSALILYVGERLFFFLEIGRKLLIGLLALVLLKTILSAILWITHGAASSTIYLLGYPFTSAGPYLIGLFLGIQVLVCIGTVVFLMQSATRSIFRRRIPDEEAPVLS